jgi:hypothetical protein
LLVDAAVAGVDVQLDTGSGAPPGVVEAFAGYRVDQRPVGGAPLLVGAAGAGPELDGGLATKIGTSRLGPDPAPAVDRKPSMGAAGGMITLVETVAFSEGEPTWVFPEGSVTQALLRSLSESGGRMHQIAAMLPDGRAGWTGSGLEYCLDPSGQRHLSGFAENADVTFLVELMPPGFYSEAAPGAWEVTAEISVRCDAKTDCGSHTIEAFTPNAYSTAEDAVAAVEKATHWLLERSEAVPPGDWQARDPYSGGHGGGT